MMWKDKEGNNFTGKGEITYSVDKGLTQQFIFKLSLKTSMIEPSGKHSGLIWKREFPAAASKGLASCALHPVGATQQGGEEGSSKASQAHSFSQELCVDGRLCSKP